MSYAGLDQKIFDFGTFLDPVTKSASFLISNLSYRMPLDYEVLCLSENIIISKNNGYIEALPDIPGFAEPLVEKITFTFNTRSFG